MYIIFSYKKGIRWYSIEVGCLGRVVKTARTQVVIDQKTIGINNQGHFKPIKISLFGFIVASIYLAAQQLTDPNAAIPTYRCGQGVNTTATGHVKFLETSLDRSEYGY